MCKTFCSSSSNYKTTCFDLHIDQVLASDFVEDRDQSREQREIANTVRATLHGVQEIGKQPPVSLPLQTSWPGGIARRANFDGLDFAATSPNYSWIT